jgi:hypothetical protein
MIMTMSSGMLRRVVWWIRTDVSEMRTASFIRAIYFSKITTED